MRSLFALVLALGLGACVDFDAKPPPDAGARDSGGTAAPDAKVDASTDAPATVDATDLVEQ